MHLLWHPSFVSVVCFFFAFFFSLGDRHPSPHTCRWQSPFSTHVQVAVTLLHTRAGGSHPSPHTCRWQSPFSTHVQVTVTFLHTHAGDRHPPPHIWSSSSAVLCAIQLIEELFTAPGLHTKPGQVGTLQQKR